MPCLLYIMFSNFFFCTNRFFILFLPHRSESPFPRVKSFKRESHVLQKVFLNVDSVERLTAGLFGSLI